MTWDDKRNERQLYQILCVPRLLEYIEDDIDYRTVLDMMADEWGKIQSDKVKHPHRC